MLLALGADDLLPELRHEWNQHGEEVPEPVPDEDRLLARLDDGARPVEAALLGPACPQAVGLATRLRAVSRELPILIVVEPAKRREVTELLRVTPMGGAPPVVVERAPGVAAQVRGLLLQARQRQRHRQTIVALNARLAAPDAPRAPAARYLDRVLLHAPLGIVFVTVEGEVRATNPHARAILATGERTQLPTLLVPEDAQRLRVALARAAQGEPPPRPLIARRDGRLLEIGLAPLDLRARPPVLLALVQDVTERERIERELAAARQDLAKQEKLAALGGLVAGVAHEIRTPLAYIANHVSLLEARLRRAQERGELAAGLEEGVAWTQSAMEGVERIDRIVRELRRFVRVEPAQKALLEVAEVVREATELFSIATRSSYQVDARLAPVGAAELDRLRIQQVVLNLLHNAAEASQGRKRIEIETRAGPTDVQILVRDHGSGIPPELQPHIFDPLFSTKDEGTGLGLPIAKRIVEEHGGSLTFESRPGEGATFVVRLPRATAAAEPPA